MTKLLSALIPIVLFSFSAYAGNIDFYLWETGKSNAPFILPVAHDKTPEQALFQYLRSLKNNSDMVELFEARWPDTSQSTFRKLSSSELSDYALLIANKPVDYSPESPRVYEFARIFKKENLKSVLLPIGIGLIFDQSNRKKVNSEIAEKFPLLVAMGGDDVSTELYKEKNFHAGYTNLTRDSLESDVIKSYIQKEKGFFIGVCRGSQLTATVLGYKLIQDLPFHKGLQIPHADDWHDIKTKKTTNNLLSSILNVDKPYKVNSIHHQSVIYKEGGFLELAATAPDGTVEATEFKNGKGILFQFHPELMNNQLGDSILTKIVYKKVLPSAKSCRRVFN